MSIAVVRHTRWALPVVFALAVTVVIARPGAGASLQAPIGLGTADAFGVLGGQTVTNTGPSVINGDLGVSPGTAITGFPSGLVNGTRHAADAVAAQAQSDLTIAYDDAAGRASDVNLSGQDLGGLTPTSGAYTFDTVAELTGTLTLDAEGNSDAVFIFQVGSTLTTASNSTVMLTNGAQACNVFWQIGSSATLGTETTFVGNVLALTSITAVTGTTVEGRLLARNGAVTLDTNVVTTATCAAAPSTTTTTVAGGGDGGPPTTVAGGGDGGPPTTVAGGGDSGPPTTVAGGGDGGPPTTVAATTVADGGLTTTTTVVAVAARLAGGPTTTVAAGDSRVTTTDAATGNSASTALGQIGGDATSSATASGPTAPALARTGSRLPVVGFALGLLLLVAGALALESGGGGRGHHAASRIRTWLH